ncbi:hypothetical protein [Halobaculum lipolyticum]|uniref:Uncharacterized protein n=1 Tax=Halobaculum lipolyticum TaxID=3032001 RepID=A0ABD5WJ08_9EURY|nr:hypothetical protein [Halobaculum sp. DT31]
MTGYHDYVLGLIPAALLGITFMLEGLGWSLQVAVPVGGAVAAGLVGHAMFVRGPVSDPMVRDAPVGGGPDAGAAPGAPSNLD